MDSLVGLVIDSIQYIVKKYQETQVNNEDVRVLAGYVSALRPVLAAISTSLDRLDDSIVRPALELLKGALDRAGQLLDDVAPMKSVELFLRSSQVAERVSGIKDELRMCTAQLGAVTAKISLDITRDLQSLRQNLDSWQIQQQQDLQEVLAKLDQQQSGSQQHQSQVMDMLSAMMEHMRTGVPQMQQEIETLLAKGTSAAEGQVGSRLLCMCSSISAGRVTAGWGSAWWGGRARWSSYVAAMCALYCTWACTSTS